VLVSPLEDRNSAVGVAERCRRVVMVEERERKKDKACKSPAEVLVRFGAVIWV
jgi:hypothetical protein